LATDTIQNMKKNIESRIKTIKFNKYRHIELVITNYYDMCWVRDMHRWFCDMTKGDFSNKKFGFVSIEYIENDIVKAIYTLN